MKRIFIVLISMFCVSTMTIFLINNQYKADDINKYIKKEYMQNFEEKVLELLNLKYPSIIVKPLYEKGQVSYNFKESYVMLDYYEPSDESGITDNFTLRVDYNEIYDYLDLDNFNFEIKLNKIYENEDGYNYDKNKTTIIFTYDDGPYKENTSEIVDILEEYKMSATFFCTGKNMEENSEILEHIFKSHSEIGYHSYSHTDMAKQSKEILKKEFEKADNFLYKLTNTHIQLTRPPFGSFNETVLETIPTPLILWEIDSKDWNNAKVYEIVDNVINYAKDGTIILMHDYYNSTREATQLLAQTLYKRNVQVVSWTDYSVLRNVGAKPGEAHYSLHE